MQDRQIPSTVREYLTAHGEGRPAEDVLKEPAALVSLFRKTAPPPDSDPLSGEALGWVTAAADCLGVMDERLYEHYRALTDLFRAVMFRAEREKLLASPAWNAVREKGVLLGILPEELYGQDRPRPHAGSSDAYRALKGGDSA